MEWITWTSGANYESQLEEVEGYGAGNSNSSYYFWYGKFQDVPAYTSNLKNMMELSWTSSPGGLNTNRSSGGTAGIQTAGLAFGGEADTPNGLLGATEEWNGSAWTK
jgi:hypothetical protein